MNAQQSQQSTQQLLTPERYHELIAYQAAGLFEVQRLLGQTQAAAAQLSTHCQALQVRVQQQETELQDLRRQLRDIESRPAIQPEMDPQVIELALADTEDPQFPAA